MDTVKLRSLKVVMKLYMTIVTVKHDHFTGSVPTTHVQGHTRLKVRGKKIKSVLIKSNESLLFIILQCIKIGGGGVMLFLMI